MSSKMDRAGVRTPAQLEQKYALGKLDKSFAQMIGVAEDARTTAEDAKKTAENAQTTAEDAKKTAENVDKNLDHEEIFNRLTKNGTLQGLYEENGQVYLNASYIKAGKVSSSVIDVNELLANNINMTGTFTHTKAAFLYPGEEELERLREFILSGMDLTSLVPLYDFNEDGIVDSIDLLICRKAMNGQHSLDNWKYKISSPVTITISLSNPEKAIRMVGTNMWGRAVDHYVGVNSTNIKNRETERRLHSLESLSHTPQLYFTNHTGGANYEMIIDGWEGLPNLSTWSCIVEGSVAPIRAGAFGYRVDKHGFFIFFDYTNTKAKFVQVIEKDGVAYANSVRDV